MDNARIGTEIETLNQIIGNLFRSGQSICKEGYTKSLRNGQGNELATQIPCTLQSDFIEQALDEKRAAPIKDQ